MRVRLYDDALRVDSQDVDRIEIEVDNSVFSIEPLMEGFRVTEMNARPVFVVAEAKDDIGVFTSFEK